MTPGRARLAHPLLWLRAHPGAFDALLASAVCALGVIAHLTIRADDVAQPSALGLVLSVLASAPIVVRRRYPAATLVAVLIPQFAMELIDAVGPGWMGVMIAAYSLGAYRNGRMMWVVGGASWLVVTLFVLWGIIADAVEWGALVSTGILYASAIALGDNMRRRRERADELVERAERAEREQNLLAHRQVQHERVRIARELHDVVAHSVSVMVIQAGAARRQLDSNPEATAEVLRLIERTGREAMSEMRRMLGVLRNELPDTEFEPQPSLATLPQLVGNEAGLPIDLRVEGDLTSVPAGVELSAYRVVQEALTNVRRHAGRVNRVEVSIVRTDDELVVEVTDDGRGVMVATGLASGPAVPGFGLVGMRERVAAFDGELAVGPRSGGGWRVRARFPLADLAARTA